jgi:hypothetical protein
MNCSLDMNNELQYNNKFSKLSLISHYTVYIICTY